jgi:hypothetical protein
VRMVDTYEKNVSMHAQVVGVWDGIFSIQPLGHLFE